MSPVEIFIVADVNSILIEEDLKPLVRHHLQEGGTLHKVGEHVLVEQLTRNVFVN